jgi:hypothetical protein
MTDRDFKLLIREYFNCKDRTDMKAFERMIELEKVIKKELENFSEKEQQSLPFK